MIIKNNQSDDYKQKMQRSLEYVESLEEERCKIQVFQRELPLCLELVSQAIEKCRKELHFHGQSECSEQTSSEGPVLEEFIPIKRTTSQEHVQNQHPKEVKNIVSSKDSKSSDKSSKKSDWLRSVQLWNHTPDPLTKQDSPRKVSVVEVKKNGSGGAFHPFKRERSVTAAQPAAPVAATSSTAETGGSSGGSKCDDKEDSQRKARRCWSPELHRRFLQALQQLGGAHVATPKQIRELMKVDGLTNDEVKSHLQKYRLHTRRPSPSIHSNNPQAHRFVVVGGLWVPPPEYATASTVATTKAVGEAAPVRSPHSGVIYAPRATVPSALLEEAGSFKHMHSQRSKEFNSGERGSHGDGSGCSNSPATSSSTHTTTASPAF